MTGSPKRAQRQRCQRHAQLHCRQKLIQMLLQVQHRARTRPVGSDHLLHARLAHAHQRKLRGHKKAVRQNEEGDQTPVHQQPLNHVPLSLAQMKKARSFRRRPFLDFPKLGRLYTSTRFSVWSICSLGT